MKNECHDGRKVHTTWARRIDATPLGNLRQKNAELQFDEDFSSDDYKAFFRSPLFELYPEDL